MRKILFFVLIGSVMMLNCFMLFEGEIVNADTTSTESAGVDIYLQYPVEVEVTGELSLTCDVSTSTMLSAISGMTGGSATSSRGCLVKTSYINGYSLTAKVSTNPALTKVSSSTISFANYTGVSTTWTVGATAAEFGFSTTGTHAINADKWLPFDGTTATTIASYGAVTSFAGVTTTMQYKAEVGNTKIQTSGLYRAWVTITATTL
ncbi:MAG: hypothetical protein Q7J14_00700 [Candidatus Magasanikbacteria bacterium]|nr:hypothetical protein [Candidatus Magasanikbacteria bacterium]